MKGGTLFSGIGAPEYAASDIDWRWCAEIEPFASAVHKHHFAGVPNLGDVTKIDPARVEPVDIVVFGSPCQSFSVAGKRLGLDDPRGNLALIALRLVGVLRPRWFLFENVPGLLSSDEGRDFGAFLGAVGQCGYGFAYRVLDAQFAGVPQRRRRLFVVGHLGDWHPAAAVLFEPASLRWHPAPSRAARQGTAGSLGASADRNRSLGNENETDFLTTGSLSSRSTAGGRLGTDFECQGGLTAIDARNGTLDSNVTMSLQGGARHERGWSLNEIPLFARCVATGTNGQRYDWEIETIIACPEVAYALSAGKQDEGGVFGSGRDSQDTFIASSLKVREQYPDCGDGSDDLVAHSLTAEDFDASEDGTGRGPPLVTHALPTCHSGGSVTEDGTRRGVPVIPIQSIQAVREKRQNGIGIGEDGDPLFTLTGRDQHAIALHENQRAEMTFNDTAGSLKVGGGKPGQGYPAVAYSTKLHNTKSNQAGKFYEEYAPSLQENSPPPAVAFQEAQTGVREYADSGSLRANDPGHDPVGTRVRDGMAVRRLTPIECERLQGFPDGYTAIRYRGKPAADGPRYRALGNSMAVPVVRWVLERIRSA